MYDALLAVYDLASFVLTDSIQRKVRHFLFLAFANGVKVEN